MDYYECHVTIGPASDRDRIAAIVRDFGWKFSAIDGDPNLGTGVKYYATRQFNARNYNDAAMVSHVRGMAAFLADKGYTVLRRKVERVIYDDRSSKVDACTDDCAGCHVEEYARP